MRKERVGIKDINRRYYNEQPYLLATKEPFKTKEDAQKFIKENKKNFEDFKIDKVVNGYNVWCLLFDD